MELEIWKNDLWKNFDQDRRVMWTDLNVDVVDYEMKPYIMAP